MAARTPGSSKPRAAAAPASSPPPPPPASPKPRKRIDWEAVERDYRTGKFSLRELEAKHSASYSEISRKAKREGWQKDLRDVIRAATSAAVLRETTTQAQSDATGVVLVAAELNAQVIMGHRSDLTRARSVALNLLDELASTAMLAEEQQLLAEVVAGGEDADPKRVQEARVALRKALDVGNRIGAVKALAEALTKLHAGERKAHGLDDEGAPPPPSGTTDWAAVAPEDRQAAYLKLISGH